MFNLEKPITFNVTGPGYRNFDIRFNGNTIYSGQTYILSGTKAVDITDIIIQQFNNVRITDEFIRINSNRMNSDTYKTFQIYVNSVLLETIDVSYNLEPILRVTSTEGIKPEAPIAPISNYYIVGKPYIYNAYHTGTVTIRLDTSVSNYYTGNPNYNYTFTGTIYSTESHYIHWRRSNDLTNYVYRHLLIPINDCNYNATLYYLNLYGGIDSIPVIAEPKYKNSTKTYEKNNANGIIGVPINIIGLRYHYANKTSLTTLYDSETSISYSLETALLNPLFKENFKHFARSRSFALLINDDFYLVNMETKSFNENEIFANGRLKCEVSIPTNFKNM